MATAKKIGVTKTQATATVKKATLPASKKIATAVPAKPATPVKMKKPAVAVAAKPATALSRAAEVRAMREVKPTVAKKVAPAATAPIKTAFTKTTLIARLAQVTGVDSKAVKSVMEALDATILASMHKKGLGAFTLPGLLKVTSVAVPAKKKRVGIDPFTKKEREFAAKPATVRVKARVMKKLKDAAL